VRAVPCGISAHARKFDVNPKAFYLKDNKSRAFTQPAWTLGTLPDDQIQDLLASKKTFKEFSALFETMSSAPPNTAVVEVSPEELVDSIKPSSSFELDSLRFASDNAGVFAIIPQLSFETEEDKFNQSGQGAILQDAQIFHLLSEYHKRVVNLKTKWT
jgi:hypothetical protein